MGEPHMYNRTQLHSIYEAQTTFPMGKEKKRQRYPGENNTESTRSLHNLLLGLY